MRPIFVSKHFLLFAAVCAVSGCSGANGGANIVGGPVTRDFGTRPSLMVTRDWLKTGFPEKSGFGAYSYVLYDGSPEGANKMRSLIDAWLKLPKDKPVKASQKKLSRKKRNITMMPIKGTPPSRPASEWVFEHYDVDRARRIISSLDPKTKNYFSVRTGPYIVTSLSPLPQSDTEQIVAVLDFTDTPTEKIEKWIDYFIRDSKHPEEWAERGAERILLRLEELIVKFIPELKLKIEAISDKTWWANAIGI